MKILYIHLLILLSCCAFDLHAQAKPLPPEIQALKDKLLADKKTLVTEPFEKGVAALNANYVAAIDRMIQSPPKTWNASEIPALQQERDMIAKGEKMPPLDFDGTAYSVKTLRQTYRSALHNLSIQPEQEWGKLKEKYLREVSALQLEALKKLGLAAASQRPSTMDIAKDMDYVSHEGKDRIVGQWKIVQSNRKEDVWTITSNGFSLKISNKNGEGIVDKQIGKFYIWGLDDDEDWFVTMKGDLHFEGMAKSNGGLKIHGERIRP